MFHFFVLNKLYHSTSGGNVVRSFPCSNSLRTARMALALGRPNPYVPYECDTRTNFKRVERCVSTSLLYLVRNACAPKRMTRASAGELASSLPCSSQNVRSCSKSRASSSRKMTCSKPSSRAAWRQRAYAVVKPTPLPGFWPSVSTPGHS